MVNRVSFSGENLSLTEIALHKDDMDSALLLFFSTASPSYGIRFTGYKPVELTNELRERRDELDRNSTMSLLAAAEAAFRIDYLQRCYRNKKDNVSREFWELYKEKGTRASLEDDIFEIWKNNTTGSARLIGELRGAFKFRHWLAHGRYWTPKLGRKYDYISVYPLVSQAMASFPLMDS